MEPMTLSKLMMYVMIFCGTFVGTLLAIGIFFLGAWLRTLWDNRKWFRLPKPASIIY